MEILICIWAHPFFLKTAPSPGYGLGTLVKNKLDKNVMIKENYAIQCFPNV